MDRSSRRFLAGHETALAAHDRPIVGEISHRRIGRFILRLPRRISAHDKNMLLIRPKHDRMRAMFARPILPGPQSLNRAKTSISSRIAHAIQPINPPAARIRRRIRLVPRISRQQRRSVGIQRIADPQHPHDFRNRQLQHFFLDDRTVLKRQPRQRLPALPAQQQPPLIVLSHIDPRTVLLRLRAQHQINLETRQRLNHFRWIIRNARPAHRLRMQARR